MYQWLSVTNSEVVFTGLALTYVSASLQVESACWPLWVRLVTGAKSPELPFDGSDQGAR